MMQREIKFRAWDKHDKKFASYNENCWEMDFSLHDLTFFLSHNDSYIFMQYTGLKDKNGVEIYEADIVKWVNREGKHTSKVEWKNYHAAFWLNEGQLIGDYLGYTLSAQWGDSSPYNSHDVEVIGNIHENPELLY